MIKKTQGIGQSQRIAPTCNQILCRGRPPCLPLLKRVYSYQYVFTLLNRGEHSLHCTAAKGKRLIRGALSFTLLSFDEQRKGSTLPKKRVIAIY